MDDVSKKSKLIALVEDDETLAEVLREILEDAGPWRLRTFSDGQIAKNELLKLRADLILLDIGLPSLDGTSLYRILRGHTDTRRTPIIVITGSYDWQLQRMGLKPEFHLHKPFNIQELISMIQSLLPEEQEG